MMARAASAPPSALSAAAAVGDAGASTSPSSWSPMRPVEQTRTSPAERPRASATASAVRCVIWKPCGAGEAVGAAGVQHDRLDDAVDDDLLRPEDRVGLGAVAREDGGADLQRAAVDDEGDVGVAGGLEAGGDARPPRIRGVL